MKQKRSNRSLVLGAIAFSIAMAVVTLLNSRLGAIQAPESYQIEPVPVPEAATAAKSTPEPVSSPPYTNVRGIHVTGAQGPEMGPVAAPRLPLTLSTVETPAPGSARQIQQPSLLLAVTVLLSVMAVAVHIASRMRAADGQRKSLGTQLEPAARW